MACRCSMAVPFLFQAVPTTEGDLLVDGIRFPRRIVTSVDGAELHTVVFESIRVNVPVDPAIFVVPPLRPSDAASSVAP